jgi:hypothetical protein
LKKETENLNVNEVHIKLSLIWHVKINSGQRPF